MAPLTKEDVTLAARSRGIDGKEFLKAVLDKRLAAWANKPVTLQMLLDIYQEDGGFPETTSELYEKGCRFLCEYEGRRGTIKWKGDFDLNKEWLLPVVWRQS